MLNKCRVLLVDDHRLIRDALRSVLAAYDDLQIIGEAGDGKQAIEMTASCQPDVILMDLNMPNMNGIEAAKYIKKSWKETVIVGLCTVQDPYTMEAFLKAGAVGVVSKVRLGDLYPTIQRACLKRSPLPSNQIAS